MTATHRPLLFRLTPDRGTTSVRVPYADIIAAGFDGVELALDIDRSALDEQVTALAAPSASAQTDEKGVQAAAVAARCTATDVAAAVTEVTAWLDRAATLHAQCLNLTIPPVGQDAGGGGFPSYQAAINFAYQLLHQVRFDAERTGVAVALEAAAGDCLLSPVELREMLDAANSWAVGACLDVTRIERVGRPEDWLRTLTHRVHAVRATLASDREAELNSIAEALDEIGHDRPVIVTGSGDPSRMRAAAARLRSVSG